MLKDILKVAMASRVVHMCLAAVALCGGVATAIPLTGGGLEPPERDGPVHKFPQGFGSSLETKDAGVVDVAATFATADSSASSLQWVEDGITHSGVVTVVCERCVVDV